MDFPLPLHLTDEEKEFAINYYKERDNDTRVILDSTPFPQLFHATFYHSPNRDVGVVIQCYHALCILTYPCSIEQAQKMFAEWL